MSSANRIILIGRAGVDADLRYTPAGEARSTFRLATNWRETTPVGTKEHTDWHEVIVEGRDGYGRSDSAKRASTLVVKGATLYVEGRLGYRKAYHHSDAPLRAVIVASRVELIQSPPEQGPV